MAKGKMELFGSMVQKEWRYDYKIFPVFDDDFCFVWSGYGILALLKFSYHSVSVSFLGERSLSSFTVLQKKSTAETKITSKGKASEG